MRKLVTIRTISDIQPIPDADKIEVAQVDGWKCVVQKGQFKVGDEALYFEVDSVLPKLEPFLFLKDFRTLYNDRIGYPLKTVRLRKQISQGLLMPLSICDLLGVDDPHSYADEGLAEAIGVWKYDPPPPVSMGGDPIGKNPSWFAKTDEERVQNLKPTDVDGSWSVTEKVDGTSMSVWVDNGEVGVGGHNWEFDLNSHNSFVRIAKNSGLLDWIGNQTGRLCVQGELAGPGIQKNPLKLSELKMFVFMIQDGNGKFNQDEIDKIYQRMISEGVDKNIICQVPRLPNVDFVGSREAIQDIIQMANDKSAVNQERKREGLVFRNLNNGNVSFKSLSSEYDLSKKE